MFIRKKVLKSLLYDIEECKKRIEHLRNEITEVRKIAYEGGYIILNRNHRAGVDSEVYDYQWHSVPVAKVLEKLFEQKKWDIGRTAEVPADIEIREFGNDGLSCRRLK